jgi:hypothetical protein
MVMVVSAPGSAQDVTLSDPLFLKSFSMKGGPWAPPETVAPPVFGKETK